MLKRFTSWFKGRGVDARSYLGSDQAFTDQWRKQREPDKAMLINDFKGAVYACSQLNVNEVIKPELRLYQRKRTSEKSLYNIKRVRNLESFCKRQKVRLNSGEEIVEITNHPFLWLKDHPNPKASWTEIIEMSQTYLELTGSCYWYVNNNQMGIPGEIWVLPPQWLRPVIIDGFISHYEYIQGVNKVDYSVEEVLPFLLPNPRRPWLDGYSWIYAIYEQLNILDKYNATEAAILDNEGLPKGIIKAKDGLSPEEAIRWEHRYNNKFRRAGAGGVLVLEDDADFTPISWAPRDLARLSVLDNARLSVANASGVPYEMISEGGSSQYNVDVTIANRHVERAIVPRLRRLQECLNRGLISRYDDSGDLFVAFDDPSPTNQEMERENLQVYVTTGIITPNEARIQLGYEETDWGSLPAGMYNAASTDAAKESEVEVELPEEETQSEE
jgi:HK97 family phage portal protein